MLAGMAQAYAQAVVRKQFVVELVDQGELNRERGRCFAATAVKTARDLAGQPGTALRGASDHHSVGARSGKRSPGIVHRADVAVDHERNRDRVLDRPHGPPVGVALVELAAGAPVYGHKADAGRLRATRKLGRVPGAVIPTEPHLERYRHRHRGHRGLDQGERMIEIAHQRRARLAAGHAHLLDAEFDGESDHALDFLERQDLRTRFPLAGNGRRRRGVSQRVEFDAVKVRGLLRLRQAVEAAKIAAVGNADPQVAHDAAMRVR